MSDLHEAVMIECGTRFGLTSCASVATAVGSLPQESRAFPAGVNCMHGLAGVSDIGTDRERPEVICWESRLRYCGRGTVDIELSRADRSFEVRRNELAQLWARRSRYQQRHE
jgi:hypothetical protein